MGFGVAGSFVALVVLTIVGSLVTDPGGLKAVGLIAALLISLLGLCLLAVYRPGAAILALAVAILAPIGFGVWTLVDFDAARNWEDRSGPVQLVLIVVVGAALAIAGLSRPASAGLLMGILAVVPAVLSVLGAGSEWASALLVGLISAPFLICGVLYLWTGLSEANSASPVAGPRVLPSH